MFRFILSFAVVAAAFASCGPDDPVEPEKEPGTEVDPGKEPEDDKGDDSGEDSGNDSGKNELAALIDSLENVLYKQVRAMQLVLTGDAVLIDTFEQKDGNYEIGLTTGASFVVAADAAYASLLSFVEEGDSKYWALLDKTGEVAAVTDVEGAKINVADAIDVKVVENKIAFKVKEAVIDLGHPMEDPIRMFGCKPLYDNNDQVYAVEFDFGAGKTKLVYVSEYSGVHMYLPGDDARTVISEIYVNTQKKAVVAVSLAAEVNWKPVVDEGWVAEIRKDGDVSYVDVTAPDQLSENLEEVPQLKIVSDDDSFQFAAINLTVNQFRTFAVSVTDAVLSPSTGLGKFAYGICLIDEYDEAAVRSFAEELIAGTATPEAGSGVSEAAVSAPFKEIFGTELDPEARYVLWALADGVFKQMEFGEIAIDIDVLDTGLLDAEVSVSINGANAIFGGVIEKTDDMMSTILYYVANQIYEPVSVDQKFVYTGSAADFPAAGADKYLLMPSTTYALWVVPEVDGEYTYSEKDVMLMEFTTNDVTPGGSLELTCGEPVVTPSTITFPLSCEGAEMIYYAYLKADGGLLYSSELFTDDVRFEQIVTSDSDYRVGGYVAEIGNKTEAVGRNLNDVDETEYWLYAVAVDSDGHYGKVLCVPATTLKLAYDNSISLSIEAYDITASSATFKVTSNGGDLSDYIYWVGRDIEPFWRNKTYCNENRQDAQKYMALNPDDDNIVNAMKKYGKLSEDGTITIDDMTMETVYVFLILEKGETYYSPVGYKRVTTLAANLGNIVKEGSDKWNAAKARIGFEWHKDRFEQPPHLMAYYSFDITCPTEFTSYIMCASEDYFDDMGLIKVEHDMIELESYAGRRVDKDHTVMDKNGNMMTEPDYTKGGEVTAGQLMNVYDFYVHGIPTEGTATYFAADSHTGSGCPAWKSGECENYNRALEQIAYHNSIEPYKKRAAQFGLTGKEADDWAQALLDAYSEHYKDAEPLLYINDGSPLTITNPYGTGVNEDGIVPDRVIVMLKDLQGNYYEPMYFEVPNYFEEK